MINHSHPTQKRVRRCYKIYISIRNLFKITNGKKREITTLYFTSYIENWPPSLKGEIDREVGFSSSNLPLYFIFISYLFTFFFQEESSPYNFHHNFRTIFEWSKMGGGKYSIVFSYNKRISFSSRSSETPLKWNKR